MFLGKLDLSYWYANKYGEIKIDSKSCSCRIEQAVPSLRTSSVKNYIFEASQSRATYHFLLYSMANSDMTREEWLPGSHAPLAIDSYSFPISASIRYTPVAMKGLEGQQRGPGFKIWLTHFPLKITIIVKSLLDLFSSIDFQKSF